MTEELSGLLAAARAANTGVLDTRRLAGLARGLGPGFRVLTGLPRPDRWRELRPAAVQELLAQAALLEQLVVIDTGPGVESEDEHTLTRDALVTAAVTSADVVVAVTAADPVGPRPRRTGVGGPGGGAPRWCGVRRGEPVARRPGLVP